MEPVTLKLPVTFQLPDTIPEPVSMSVSTAEKVELLPETIRDPLIIAPLDAVIDDKSALLPLTITLFQVANYCSIVLLFNSYSTIYKYGLTIVLVKL